MHQYGVIDEWAESTKDICRNIELIWVKPYRNGVLDKGAFYAH